MAAMGAERSDVQARRFYSQRNMYLCGSTLFLSVILNRTYMLVLDTLRLQDKLMKYEGDPAAQGKESEKLSAEGRAAEIGQLKRELAKKDKDLQGMKSQAEGLRREYDELSLKYNQLNPGSNGDKKSN
jgi:B-cell receptor-associated protein 31